MDLFRTEGRMVILELIPEWLHDMQTAKRVNSYPNHSHSSVHIWQSCVRVYN